MEQNKSKASLLRHEKIWLGGAVECLAERGTVGNSKINLLLWLIRNSKNLYLGDTIDEIMQKSALGRSLVYSTTNILLEHGYLVKSKKNKKTSYFVNFGDIQ